MSEMTINEVHALHRVFRLAPINFHSIFSTLENETRELEKETKNCLYPMIS